MVGYYSLKAPSHFAAVIEKSIFFRDDSTIKSDLERRGNGTKESSITVRNFAIDTDGISLRIRNAFGALSILHN
tara:strand:+ start:538 stop:759 length:222 start_codon:yes stop_codon:yes gene_type:complete